MERRDMINKTAAVCALVALAIPALAQASGPIVVEYGERTFLIAHRAGYVGLYRSEQRDMVQSHIAGEEAKGYYELGPLVARLREFKQSARRRGLPVEDFSPYFPAVKLGWNQEGELGYYKEYTWHNYAPGVLGKEIHFPANVMIEHEEDTVTFTVSQRLDPTQKKLLRDMLIKLLDSVDTDSQRPAQPGLRIDPDQLRFPVVMIEQERHVVCARLSHPLIEQDAAAWEKELRTLATAVDADLAEPLAALDADEETKGVLRPVLRAIRAPGDERPLVPARVCGRHGPNWSDNAELELQAIDAVNDTLDLRVLIATTEEDWKKLYEPLRGALGPVLTRAYERQIAKLEYDVVVREQHEPEPVAAPEPEPEAEPPTSVSRRWAVIAGTAALILLVVVVIVVRRRQRR